MLLQPECPLVAWLLLAAMLSGVAAVLLIVRRDWRQMLLPVLRGPVHPSAGFCERCGAGAPPNMWYWPWRSDGS